MARPKHERIGVYDIPSLPEVAERLELALKLMEQRFRRDSRSDANRMMMRGTLAVLASLITSDKQQARVQDLLRRLNAHPADLPPEE